MFRTVPLSIIRTFSLYSQQYMQVLLSACSHAVSKIIWHIPLLCVQWKTPDDGPRNCPKHADFYSKNKFEKLVQLVGCVIRRTHFCLFRIFLPQLWSGLSYNFCKDCGPGSSVGIATELRAGRYGIESRWGRFFSPVQTGTWGPNSLL